jgi:hypothetical protein
MIGERFWNGHRSNMGSRSSREALGANRRLNSALLRRRLGIQKTHICPVPSKRSRSASKSKVS